MAFYTRIVLLQLLICFCFIEPSHAQFYTELESNAGLTIGDLKQIPQILNSDSLNVIYYKSKDGYPGWYIGYTTEPLEDGKILGCKGDFNWDGLTDYAIYVRNLVRQQDQPRVYVTGIDSHFVLNQWHETYKKILEEYPYGGEKLECFEKSDTGVFWSNEFKDEVEMHGDVINLSWYTFVWDPVQNKFKKVLTSD